MSETSIGSDRGSRGMAAFRLIVYSAIGIFFFFIPVTINERSTLLIDHAASAIASNFRPVAIVFVTALIAYGALAPFISGSWKKNRTEMVFSALRVLGLILTVMFLAGVGPAAIFEPDMLPFLFDRLVMSVGLIVPIGALALGFLIGYGLLELTGVIVQPVMRPVWRTPGWSAIDAVASFVGSYSLALLITDRLYKEGRYTTREAAIIATGFATVSVAFMIVVARTLGLMEMWNFYFWSTLVITFIVSAIVARLWPISSMEHEGDRDQPLPERRGRIAAAIDAGLEQAARAPSLLSLLKSSLIDGLRMASLILPSIMAVGLLGLLASKYTPLFDVLGLTLYPFTWLVQLSEPMQAASALSAGLAEMFLPAVLLAEADAATRLIAGIVCVSQILFLSASIPCVMATTIPISIWQLVVIWYVRTVASILLAAPVAWFAVSMGWIA
ncbi:YjiH family protein [Aliihoeflea sp. PC F10.4]